MRRRNFAALVKKRGIAPETRRDARQRSIRSAHMAATGSSPRPWNELAPIFAGLVDELAADGFRGPFAVADGRVIHDAGGSEAQELAFALGERRHLSARAGSGRHRARCGARA